jgi:hypothetical protein
LLSYTEELRDRIAGLLADVGPLHTVSAVGFAESRADRVAASLGAVSSDQRWRFVDMRAGGDAKELAAALAGDVVVVATKCNQVPSALRGVVHAFVDARDALDLGDGAPKARRPSQSLILVCEGCTEIGAAARELTRVPYWEFIA